MLSTAEAFKNTSFYHDTHFVAKCFSLVHTMRREDNSTRFILSYPSYHSPHKPSSFGVHTCRWLIKKNNRWITDNCIGDTDFTLIATAQSSDSFFPLFLKTKPINRLIDQLWTHFFWQTLDLSEIINVFLNRKLHEKQIRLGTISNQFPGFFKLRIDVVTIDMNRSFCRIYFSC